MPDGTFKHCIMFDFEERSTSWKTSFLFRQELLKPCWLLQIARSFLKMNSAILISPNIYQELCTTWCNSIPLPFTSFKRAIKQVITSLLCRGFFSILFIVNSKYCTIIHSKHHKCSSSHSSLQGIQSSPSNTHSPFLLWSPYKYSHIVISSSFLKRSVNGGSSVIKQFMGQCYIHLWWYFLSQSILGMFAKIHLLHLQTVFIPHPRSKTLLPWTKIERKETRGSGAFELEKLSQ